MKYKVLIVIVSVISTVLLCFGGGYYVGFKQGQDYWVGVKNQERLFNEIMTHRFYDGLLEEFKNGEMEMARCNLEQISGVMYGWFQECYGDSACRARLPEDLSDYLRRLEGQKDKYAQDALRSCTRRGG